MRAILPATETSNAMQPQNKETTQTWVLVGVKKCELKELVTARWYMSRSSQASVVYCCVWVHGDNQWFSGKGTAGGYGYHKYSAALDSALSSAGIKLVGSPYHGPERTFEQWNGTERVTAKQDFKQACHIGGCGDRAAEDAIKAVGYALGYKKLHLVRG